MFESIIVLFIKRYIARYIEINIDQLSAQLLYKQQIIIENLTLNKTILNEDIFLKLKIPFQFESISIGKIQCQFILSSLFFHSSSPAFIIKIEHVYIILKDNNNNNNDFLIENFDENNNYIIKSNQLDLFEQQLEKEFECFGEVKTSKWNVQRLLMSFSEKLQIDIFDIHINYQSSLSYTIGLTCDKIQISNEPSSNENMNRQIIQIINLGIYIDINNSSIHSYIFSPSSSIEIHLIHNHFQINQKEYHYEFECILNDLNMKFNIEQARILINMIYLIQNSIYHRMLISDKNRPNIKISKQSAKIWWRYIILRIRRKQMYLKNLTTNYWFNRSLFLYRLHQLIIYKHLYRLYIDNKYFNSSNFSLQDKILMNKIEIEFDIEYLLIIRRSIFQIRINEELNQKKETIKWYSKYAKWITTKLYDLWEKNSSITENSDRILNENNIKFEEQVKIFITESLEDEDLLENSYNTLIFRFKFFLKSIQIDLLSLNNDIHLTFYLKNLSIIEEFRLRQQSISISASLEDIYVRNQGQIDIFSTIICSKDNSQQNVSQSVPIFKLLFEKKGKSKYLNQSVYSIDIRSCGFCITCCPTFAERLHHLYMSIFDQSFLSLSLSLYDLKQIKNYIIKNFISMLEQIIPTPNLNSRKLTIAYLQNIRRTQHRIKRKFHINIDIGAPKIIIPLSKYNSFIIDLGSLIMTNSTNDVVAELPYTELTQQQFQVNDDDEEFLTPDSSPLGNDIPLEEETTYYSINIISEDIKYSSCSLNIRDIHVQYSNDLSQIIENFNVNFILQHSLDHLWPLTNISGSLQKIIIHLDSEKIQNLWQSINPWIIFMNNLIPKQNYHLNIWPIFDFHFDEIDIQLSYNLNPLCNFYMENIDLSLINNKQSDNFIFILQTLTIFDCIQDNEILLKINQISNVNNPFIHVNISQNDIENNLLIDINIEKFYFIFNPKIICRLINFLMDINLLSSNRILFRNFNNKEKQICYKINIKFQEINILITSITSAMISTEVYINNISLNILSNRFLTCEGTINSLQIFHIMNNSKQQQCVDMSTIYSKQKDLIVDLGVQLNNKALYLLLTTMENNNDNLSIKMTSISYIHSLEIISISQQIFDYMTENCRLFVKKENDIKWLYNYFIHLILNIDLNKLKINFPNNIALQLDSISMKKDHNQLSNYEITINQINFINTIQFETELNHIDFSWEFIENISINLNLEITNKSIGIISKINSPIQIFLSQNRIKFLEEILHEIFLYNTKSLFKFYFHLQSYQMIIIFQTDYNNKLIPICKGILEQCHMIYKLDYPNNKIINIQFNSFHMKDYFKNINESFIQLNFPSYIELNSPIMDNQQTQFNIKFNQINIKFIKSTWIFLSEIIQIINYRNYFSTCFGLQEKKKHPTEIIININSISCTFSDNITLLMKISLEHFIFQFQTSSKQSLISSTINGQLDRISIHDLSTIDQLYNERLCTTNSNAIIFRFITKTDHDKNLSIRPQFNLQMTSMQYIHTQEFFLKFIHFLNYFQLNEDFYNTFQSLIIKPIISKTSQQLNDILLNIDIKNFILILPEHILKKSVIIFQLDYINFKNHFLFQNQLEKINIKSSQLDFISIEIKNIDFYSASYYLINEQISKSIRFSNYEFNRKDNKLSSIVREPFNLNIKIEHNFNISTNHTPSTYIIKMNLSSINIFFDLNHYHLIENILRYNLIEQSNKNLFNSLLIQNNDKYIDLTCIIEIDQIGMEIFVIDIDLLLNDDRRSLGYAGLINLHINLNQYSNGEQIFHLRCPTIKFLDTRNKNEDMIISLSTPLNPSQFEIHLLRSKHNQQCTLTINSMRFLFIIDWLIEFNEYINLFCEQQTFINNLISIKYYEIKLQLNQFELVLVSTTNDPYTNALIYSSTMMINYKSNIRSFECLMTNFTLLTCQIGNIIETSVSIIEPNDFFLNIYTLNNTSDEQICDLNMPILNIRLLYSDIKMIYSIFELISKQLSHIETRKHLLTFMGGIVTSPIRDCQIQTKGFLNIKNLNFISNQIYICLIDDCFGVNIPLLNMNIKSFNLQTIENIHLYRIDQCDFELYISYYNRFQSGFEPLIELCQLQMILNRSSSTISLSISSKERLDLNFTKSMYRLYDIIKKNWNIDYKNSKKKKQTFRQVKPLEPYCFKNLIGIPIKFRTWLISQQCFNSHEHIVNNNEIVSFYFPTNSSQLNLNQFSNIRQRSNSVVTSLFQSDRRLLISIDGWQTLQPISIDRIGTFFRLAIPSDNNSLYKPIIVIIDIAMTNTSIRSITIRSSIEIHNKLLTSIDIRLKSKMNLLEDFRLEPNEIRSLPIQFCSLFEQIQIRPADFALDYCDNPINWSDIENENISNCSLSKENPTTIHQSFLCTCSIDEKEPIYYACLESKQTYLLPYQDHILSIYQLFIYPPLTICNLLPCILDFEIPIYPKKFQLNPYKYHREHGLDIHQDIDIIFSTNIYHMNKLVRLPSLDDLYRVKHTHQRISFYDNTNRELFVDLTIVCIMKYRLKISISVPFVLLNKSGIPLIIKETNSKIESSGQNLEDELILNKNPLLFSFDNINRNNTCVMRVGTGLHQYQDGRPQWSQRFNLDHGSTYRQLQVRSSRNSSDWNYSIGIDIRPGNGHLKKINFIFLSARYMICNQCSYDLLLAQQYFINNDSNFLYISKQATVAFHWPRTDIEQLLCVRAIDDNQNQLIHWSGGFLIDDVNAFHINMRYENGQCLILRVQIIERNSTFFVIFMDSNKMPVPFRISNLSDIPIQFNQTEIREELIYLYTTIFPHQSIDYAWDEPTLKQTITCSIIDGTKATYDLLKLGSADNLYYQNFIYLAFQDTFNDNNIINSLSCQLVIDYIDNHLVLSQCQENKRSQLWQMTNNGLLIHIGSLTINDLNKKKDSIDDIRQKFVLDIEDLTENNLTTNFIPLTIRRYDPKRTYSQTWQFHDNGYLCLAANTQMCIQVFGELKENSNLILGPIIKNNNLLPIPTMHIRSHQRYKGSGVLSVRVTTDGPTNVLEINHIETDNLPNITSVLPSSSSSSSLVTLSYRLNLDFPAGIGISIIGSIGHESEELLYVVINNIHIEYIDKDNEQSIEGIIDNLIISNQLLSTTKPCFLYANYTEDALIQSAIHLQINWQKLNKNFTLIHIIHSFHIDINSITIQLDEILLWKLIDFFDIEISSISSLLYTAIGFNNNSNTDRQIDLNINDYETERILSLITSTNKIRFYFNKFYISPIDLNLSIYCIHSKRLLSSHLLNIKRRASFPLVAFENAQIHLKSYEQIHIFNTYDFLLLSIITHYINVCKKQALKILGTVDFLGNPLGLIQDVSDGLTCLVDQHSVSGLVRNVAHGVADTTIKVTGSISHGLEKFTLDNEHNERRHSIINTRRGQTLSHVFRQSTAGLAAGFYGGLTSMFKQPYKGAVEQGMPGLVKGFAKGIVGTVSKPMAGILDFTNDMAMAIKEGSRSSNTILNNRLRLPRCPSNILGLLQSYSIFDAQGHLLLYKINKGNNLIERYISRVILSTRQDNISDKQVMITNRQRNKQISERKDNYIDAMITTQRVIIYQIDDDPDMSNFEIINSYDFNTLTAAVPIEDTEDDAYVQFFIDLKTSNISNQSIHRCDTIEQATILCNRIQHAQDIFNEEKMICNLSDNDDIFDNEENE